MSEYKATHKYARIGPRKARLVVDLIRGADVNDAFETLRFSHKRAAFFIGNDSGLMHLAAAAGTPTVGLFGPSRTELYAPWGERTAAVRTDEPFEALMARTGPGGAVRDTLMRGLTVTRAADAATALLNQALQARTS